MCGSASQKGRGRRGCMGPVPEPKPVLAELRPWHGAIRPPGITPPGSGTGPMQPRFPLPSGASICHLLPCTSMPRPGVLRSSTAPHADLCEHIGGRDPQARKQASLLHLGKAPLAPRGPFLMCVWLASAYIGLPTCVASRQPRSYNRLPGGGAGAAGRRRGAQRASMA